METRKELNTLADQPCWTIFVNHVTPFTRKCGDLVKTGAKLGNSGRRRRKENFSGFKNLVNGVAEGSYETLHVTGARPVQNRSH